MRERHERGLYPLAESTRFDETDGCHQVAAVDALHDNKHFLSDVTFGAAMGIAGARTVLLKAGRYGVHMAPALAPSRVALRATLVRAGHE